MDHNTCNMVLDLSFHCKRETATCGGLQGWNGPQRHQEHANVLCSWRQGFQWYGQESYMPARDWEEDVLEPHPPRNTRRDQGPKQLTALLTHRASSPSSKQKRTTAENRRRSRKTPTFFAMSEASLAPRAPRRGAHSISR